MISAVTQSLFTKCGAREPEHAILANFLSPRGLFSFFSFFFLIKLYELLAHFGSLFFSGHVICKYLL